MNRRLANGYDFISSFYDDIAGLIFGKSLFDAQTFFFSEIPDGGNVLILGGGSGWILPILFQQKPDINICYIDVSGKMLELAKKRTYPGGRVQFIQGTEESIPEDLQFDSVILNFYVDGFSPAQLPSRLMLINASMKKNATWLVTDFMPTHQLRHQFIVWLTHVFFRILIKHPNKRLAEWWKVFEQTGFVVKKERSWTDGLIKSLIYSRG